MAASEAPAATAAEAAATGEVFEVTYKPKHDGDYFAPELEPGQSLQVGAEQAATLLGSGQFTAEKATRTQLEAALKQRAERTD